MSAARIIRALSLTRQAEWAAEQDLRQRQSLFVGWQAGRQGAAQTARLKAMNERLLR